MFIHVEWPPPGKRLVPGVCPNAGHPCNCIGACQPILVDESLDLTDEEIRARYRNPATGRSWTQTAPNGGHAHG